MSTPIPKKKKTTAVHCKKDSYDVYIGRPSKWGNLFTEGTKAENIRDYKEYVLKGPLIEDIEELRGKTLGCWCRPGRCHGDVLIELLREKEGPWE